MEPGFSHCSIGHDFFQHTGRKHFLLNVKIYSSQSWSGKQLDTGRKRQDMSLHCVPAGEVDRMSPGSVLLRRWKKQHWHSPTHTGEGGEGMVLELLGRLFSADGEKCLVCSTRPSRTRLGCLNAHGPLVAFSSNFGRSGSTSLQHCSGDPDPLVGSGLWFLPTCWERRGIDSKAQDQRAHHRNRRTPMFVLNA